MAQFDYLCLSLIYLGLVFIFAKISSFSFMEPMHQDTIAVMKSLKLRHTVMEIFASELYANDDFQNQFMPVKKCDNKEYYRDFLV